MPPRSILLDATALSLLADDAQAITAWCVYARNVDADLYVSTVTLAETTDGNARDANLRRALKACVTLPVTEEIGFRGGVLRAKVSRLRRKPRDLTVDALVAATAFVTPPPTVVLTGDPSDLKLLLTDSHVAVERVG